MTIDIELDGERRQVALKREDDRWIAGIDGRTMDVSVVEAGGRWSMLLNPAEAGLHSPTQCGSDSAESGSGRSSSMESGSGRSSSVESGFSRISSVESGFSGISYEIAFEPAATGELIVHVNGVAIPLTIADSRRGLRQRGGDRGWGSGPRTIVAPMPGRIVKVLVKPNESVSARQPLVVVEAMKMENELRAPRSGTIAEVRVSEGASVEANAVLVVLE
jgi:biotin carboxyl carrier protein